MLWTDGREIVHLRHGSWRCIVGIGLGLSLPISTIQVRLGSIVFSLKNKTGYNFIQYFLLVRGFGLISRIIKELRLRLGLSQNTHNNFSSLMRADVRQEPLSSSKINECTVSLVAYSQSFYCIISSDLY